MAYKFVYYLKFWFEKMLIKFRKAKRIEVNIYFKSLYIIM